MKKFYQIDPWLQDMTQRDMKAWFSAVTEKIIAGVHFSSL